MQGRQRVGQHVERSAGDNHLSDRIEFGLDNVDCIPSREIAEKRSDWLPGVRLIGAVESPVCGDDIQSAIAIDVACCHSIPPTGVARKTEFAGDVVQLALVILKHPYGPPFTSQNQFWKTVAVQITPDGPAD